MDFTLQETQKLHVEEISILCFYQKELRHQTIQHLQGLEVAPELTDITTLIPFLKSMKENLNFKYLKIVADAGYESEENYSFIEENNQISFIKPANYEISKTKIQE